MRTIYLAPNGRSDTECVYLDLDNEDNEFWRGYSFDNHYMAFSKKEHREVPTPAWAEG